MRTKARFMPPILVRRGVNLPSGPIEPPDPNPVSSFSGDLATRPWYSVATWPAAVHHSGKTYLGYIAETPPQTAKIKVYDHSDGSEETHVIDTQPLADDDHGVVSLCVLSDGRMAAFYGSHGTDQQWSISDQSGGDPDVSNWTRQSAISGQYNYPKPVNIDDGGGDGTLWLAMRRNDAGPAYKLVLFSASYTSGGAVSLGSETVVADMDGRPYAGEVRADQNGDLEILVTRSDIADTWRRNVYYFRYMTATGAVENISGGVSIASGSLPVDILEANADYREVVSGSNLSSNVSWCRDANGDLHILYGDDVDGSSSFDVKHNVYSGGSWGTAETVFQVTDAVSGNGFVEDWCLVPGDTGDRVEAWYPYGDTGSWANRGGDSMARKVYSSGTWGAREVIHTGENARALGVPTSVFNAHADFRVAFMEVSQSAAASSKAAMERYGYGDSGFVQWPDLTDPHLYANCLQMYFNGADAVTSTEDSSRWRHLHPVTFNGTAQLDTAQQKFGSASLLLDGNSDYLTIPRSRTDLESFDGAEFLFSVGDTLEVHFRPNEVGRTQAILSTRTHDGMNHGWTLVQLNDNKIYFVGWDDSVTAVINISTTTTVTTGQWYYVAVKQVSALEFEIWIDGAEEDSDTASSQPDEGGTLYIGRTGNIADQYYNGWIDSIRWTKGIDRDVSSVPTAEFPNE